MTTIRPTRRAVVRLLLAFLLALATAPRVAVAQVAVDAMSAAVTVRVVSDDGPVEGADVVVGGVALSGIPTGRAPVRTDERGEATFRLPAGRHELRVEAFGFRTATASVEVRANADTLVIVTLDHEALEHEEIIVSSTRLDRRIEDEPVRVEAIGREEIEEKLLMTPGDIAMLLNETAGLRVQTTSASLGGASVRIQGLRGRYTQILSDGLPLHGGQTGALGPLQIPPMDLGQVEVIKGAASALYGASALGGVVNLLSRRPAMGGETELLLNQTTLGGTDAILWRSDVASDRWGYTLLASGHRQEQADPDDDGWADLPSFRRGLVRPRLFWSDGAGRSALLTVGGMLEEREGGSLPGRSTPEGVAVREALRTERLDAGAIVRLLPGGDRLVTVRGSGALQRHEHRFHEAFERDAHGTGFLEATLSGAAGAHLWVVGAAVQLDDYDARSLEGFDYTFTVPGLLAQDEWMVSDELTLAASTRLDRHSEHGTFVSPRLSVLMRPDAVWSLRASAGTGYFAPTPWTDETEAVGLGRLTGFDGLRAEVGRSASLDVARTIGPLELNATVFGSRLEHAVQARPAGADEGRLELTNAGTAVRTYGTELLARFHREGIHVTATHVYLRSTEPHPVDGHRREVPLTPRHTAGLVGAWEQEGRSRIGVELYFTGRQELDEDPYRDRSEPHVIVGFLVERRLGPARVFLNAENLLDTRQTREDPLVLPARSPQGRWTTDVWAPLEGRSFNAGVRWEL